MKLNKQRLTIVLVFATFFLPLTAAIILNSDWIDISPGSLNNKGHLIQPPILLQANDLKLVNNQIYALDQSLDVWTVVIVESYPCLSHCIERLSLLASIKKLLGKDIDRTPMLLQLIGNENDTQVNLTQLSQIPPFSNFTLLDHEEFIQLMNTVGAEHQKETSNNLTGNMFIINNGYLFMHYDAQHTPNDLWSDLKRLLKAKGRGDH